VVAALSLVAGETHGSARPEDRASALAFRFIGRDGSRSIAAVLASDVGGRSADHAATDSHLEVARVLDQRLSVAQQRYADRVAGPAERADERLREVALPGFVLRGQERSED